MTELNPASKRLLGAHASLRQRMLNRSKLKPPSPSPSCFKKDNQHSSLQIIPVAISMDEGETPRANNNSEKGKTTTIDGPSLIEESPPSKKNTKNQVNDDTTKENDPSRQPPTTTTLKIPLNKIILGRKQKRKESSEKKKAQEPRTLVAKKELNTLVHKLGGPPKGVEDPPIKQKEEEEVKPTVRAAKKKLNTLVDKLGGPSTTSKKTECEYPFPQATKQQVQSVMDSSLFSLASSEDISTVEDAEGIPNNSLTMSSFSHSSFGDNSPFMKRNHPLLITHNNNNNNNNDSSLLQSPPDDALRHRNVTLVKEIRFAEQTCVELSVAQQQQQQRIQQLEQRLQENQDLHEKELRHQEERHAQAVQDEVLRSMRQQRDDLKQEYQTDLRLQSQVLHAKLKENYIGKLQDELQNQRQQLEQEHQMEMQQQQKVNQEHNTVNVDLQKKNEELQARNEELSHQVEEMKKPSEQPHGVSPVKLYISSSSSPSARRPDPSSNDDDAKQKKQSEKMDQVVSDLEEQHEKALFQQKKQLQLEFQQLLQTVKDTFLRKAASLETEVMARLKEEQQHLARLQQRVDEQKRRTDENKHQEESDATSIIQELEQSLASAHDDIQYQLETIAMLEHQLQEHEQKFQTLQESFSQDTAATTTTDVVVQQLREQLAAALRNNNEDTYSSLRRENLQLQAKLKELEQQLQDQTQVERQFHQLEALLLHQQDTQDEELRDTITQLQTQNARLTAIVHEKEQQLQDQAVLEDQFQSSLHGEILQLQEDVTILESERETLIEEYEVQIRSLQEEISQLVSALDETKQERSDRFQLENDTQLALQQEIGRLQNLLQQADNYESQTDDQLKLQQVQIRQINDRQDQQTEALQEQLTQLQMHNTQLTAKLREKEEQLQDQSEIDYESQYLLQEKIRKLKEELQTQQVSLEETKVQHSQEIQSIQDRHSQQTETLCETISQLESESAELEDTIEQSKQQVPTAMQHLQEERTVKQKRLEEFKTELMNVKTLHTKFVQEAKEQRRQLEQDLKDRENDYAVLQADYATCNNKLTAAIQEVSRHKQLLEDFQTSTEEAVKLSKENAQAKLQTKIESLQEQFERSRQDHQRQLEHMKRLKDDAEQSLRLTTSERDDARSDRQSFAFLQTQLKESIKTKDEQIKNMKNKLRLVTRERDAAYDTCAELQVDRENNQVTIQASIALKADEIKNMKEKIRSLKAEKSELVTQVDQLHKELSGTKQNMKEQIPELEVVHALETFNQILEGLISKAKQNLSNANFEFHVESIDATERKSWKEQLTYAKMIVTEMNHLIRRSSDELLEQREKLNQLRQRNHDLDMREKQLQQSEHTLQNQLFDAKKEIQEASSEIVSTSKDLLETNKALERMQQALEEKSDYCQNLANERDDAQRKLAFLSGKLEESSGNQEFLRNQRFEYESKAIEYQEHLQTLETKNRKLREYIRRLTCKCEEWESSWIEQSKIVMELSKGRTNNIVLDFINVQPGSEGI
eukprot:CAMPEP_0194240956 /NCGR_PEP_ID=MMETSP0158-20130606/6975_1 /TAXON_ID=33649 /ORGANISM="Thalassionema nitzschioides, Strain L26-B" /LENGTH=1495 /DNA_ID=CAMNT_0038975763 /DNA_START=7 /DNA_END=4494 /DNA_ORIENTATION=+